MHVENCHSSGRGWELQGEETQESRTEVKTQPQVGQAKGYLINTCWVVTQRGKDLLDVSSLKLPLGTPHYQDLNFFHESHYFKVFDL